MDTESFLTAIRDDPDDDNLRLVFADWLDDHDEADRAALIRRQCAIARLRRLLGKRDALFLNSIETQEQPPRHLIERWLGRLPDSVPVRFRGGLARVTLSSAYLAAQLTPELRESVRQGWVESVTLLGALGDRWPLVDFPEIVDAGQVAVRVARPEVATWLAGRVRTLAITTLYECDQVLAELAEAPGLRGLGRLTLSGGVRRAAGLAALLRSRGLAGLTHLDITAPLRTGDDWGDLFEDCQLERLQHLGLHGCRLGLEQVRGLASCPALAGLTSLALEGDQISVAAARALAESPHLLRLERLSLKGTRIGDAGILALVESPLSTRLTHLQLSSCDVGVEGARLLARSPRCAGLLGLVLDHNRRLGDAGVTELTSSPHLSRLAVLDLGKSRIGDAGAQALADSPCLESLEYLDLLKNRLTDRGAEAFAQSKERGRLTCLSLRGCPTTAQGGHAVVFSLSLPALAHLDFTITDRPLDLAVNPTARVFWQQFFSRFSSGLESATARLSAALEGLRSEHVRMRRHALETIAPLLAEDSGLTPAESEAAFAGLRSALGDAETVVRRQVLSVYGRCCSRAADTPIPPLVEEGLLVALRSGNSGVRGLAARALAVGRPSAAAIPALQKAATDAEAVVRRRAVRALTNVLQRSLQDPDEGVRRTAQEALAVLQALPAEETP